MKMCNVYDLSSGHATHTTFYSAFIESNNEWIKKKSSRFTNKSKTMLFVAAVLSVELHKDDPRQTTSEDTGPSTSKARPLVLELQMKVRDHGPSPGWKLMLSHLRHYAKHEQRS